MVVEILSHNQKSCLPGNSAHGKMCGERYAYGNDVVKCSQKELFDSVPSF